MDGPAQGELPGFGRLGRATPGSCDAAVDSIAIETRVGATAVDEVLPLGEREDALSAAKEFVRTGQFARDERWESPEP